jgi:hypothetical protein
MNFKKYLATNALHLGFFIELVNLIMKFGVDVLKVLVPFEVLRACVAKEDLCYKVVRKSNISALKEKSDHARDMIILSIKDIIKSALRHFDENICEAAKRLKILFDAHDNPQPIIKLPYDAETAAIKNLLQDLEGKFAADVEITGLTTWVKELRKRNDDFEELAKAYNEQQSEKPLYRPKEVRKETDQAYQDLLTVIKGNIIDEADGKGEALYTPFITELNTLVKHYNDLIAQHIGRVHAEKEKEKNNDEQPPDSREPASDEK